ncbi:MAG: caspase family protein [Chloroflexi bacterium]|nr:MAG: caspase family protein [Chloroflexota bacterium]
MTTFAQGHALLIGVGADLPNTIADAEELHSFLIAPDRCAYPPAQVQLLTGEGATRSHILTALDKLAQASTPESTVVVYYSGHGYQVETKDVSTTHYLLPYGYQQGTLQKSAISGAELLQKLQAIPAQKLLLLLDCCHAGGLDDLPAAKSPALEFTKAPLPPEAIELLAQGEGRAVIASCTEGELSFGGDPYSAFTLALLEALDGQGAAKKDGYVYFSDLAAHTRQKVPLRTKDRQHPTFDFRKSDNFIVAYYAGGEMQPKGLPFKVEDVVIEETPGELRGVGQIGHRITNTGSGAVATDGGVAAGEGGVAIQGDSHGPITLDNRRDNRRINTGGGTYVAKDVNVSGGDFVGRDKKVSGDKIRIGNISDSKIGNIGRGTGSVTTSGPSVAELALLFAPLMQSIQNAPADSRPEAVAAAQELVTEAAKGSEANDETVAELVTALAKAAPDAVQALVGLFAPAALGKLAGAVTRFALRTIQKQ